MAVINFPDPAGQTPLNTYSPTSQPYGTSNGVTYVWDSGAWTIKGSAGGGTDGDGLYLSLAADAGDQTVQSTGTTTFTGQVVLPGGGSDTEALQKQEVEALIDASDTADGNYLKLAAAAGDQTVQSTGTTTFTGQVVLPGGGSDTEALQKQEVEALIDASDTADGNYLKLAAAAGDQTVASTGTTTFNGVVEAGGGVKVSGGTASVVKQGMAFGSGRLRLASGSKFRLYISEAGHFGANVNAQSDSIFNIGGETDSLANNSKCFRAYPTLHDNVTTYSGFASNVKLTAAQAATTVHHFIAQATNVNDGGTVQNAYGFNATNELATGENTNIGFRGDIPADGSKNYNFYAEGSAANFFKGDTYIGGSVSRNTRELWESTLTEEQKEQLSAGTLAIPANVSVPGDGSFARQWWYNQQSAEDQALIDSGELDYPSHFQAANFVDTFALGDATNIDFIAADGTVKLKGISFNKGATTADKIDFNGFYFSNFHNCPLLLASCHSDSDTEVTALKVTPYAYYPETDKNKNLTKAIGLYLESPIVTQGDNDDALLDDIRTIGIQGHDAAKLSENGSSYCISSFQNNPGSAEIALGKTAYNFYADGTAPNYFAGDVLTRCERNRLEF